MTPPRADQRGTIAAVEDSRRHGPVEFSDLPSPKKITWRGNKSPRRPISSSEAAEDRHGGAIAA
jgi:hypothetical protein